MRDPSGFDAFCSASVRRLIGQMHAMTGSRADAEDCVQEAYARAWQRWDKVSGYGDPEAWVRTVAYRISVSAWRKAASMRVAHRKHGAPDDSRGMSPDYVAIVTALRRVPPSQRQAIVLHHLAGKSVDEIARETGAASGTVKARLSRGRPSDRGWTENRRTLARSRAAARRLAMSLRCTEYGAVAKGWPPLISCKNGSSADLSKAPEPAARPEDEHPFARPEAGLVDEAHGGSAIVEQGGRLCHPQTFWHDQAERDGRVSPARLLASPGRGVARIRWISSRVQFVFPDAGEG